MVQYCLFNRTDGEKYYIKCDYCCNDNPQTISSVCSCEEESTITIIFIIIGSIIGLILILMFIFKLVQYCCPSFFYKYVFTCGRPRGSRQTITGFYSSQNRAEGASNPDFVNSEMNLNQIYSICDDMTPPAYSDYKKDSLSSELPNYEDFVKKNAEERDEVKQSSSG